MTRTKCVWKIERIFVVLFAVLLTSIQGLVLEFTVEPKDTVVVAGASAVLDCAARSSDPKAKILIQWHDQDQQPVTFIGDTYRSQLTNGSLYISSVIENQGLTGAYQCRAILPNVGSIVSRTATVTLASLSGFLQEPNDITVYPGQTAYFACRVQATPAPRVIWLKDERPLQLDALRMTVLPSGALEIDDVDYLDQGTYRCNASGLSQYRLSNKATLAVNENSDLSDASAPQFIAVPTSTEVVEGQTVTLDCAANGNPKPWISWLKDGISVDFSNLDSQFRRVGTSSLHISKIQDLDAGTYQCRAENREDSLDASANVHVLVPPKFLKKPSDKTDAVNKDTEFECSIYGKPDPKVQWLKNGEVITPNEYMQLVSGHNLKILGLMEVDAGIFQCVGSNPAGNVQASARLKITGTGNKSNRKKQRNNSPNNKKSDDVKPTKTQLRDILSSLKLDTFKSDTLGNTEFAHSLTSREYTFNGDADESPKINPKLIFTSLKQDNNTFTNLGETLPVYTPPNPESRQPLDFLDDSSTEVAGVPGKPQDLKAVIVKARFVTLSWKAPDVTNGDIVAYSVYYRQEGSQRERVQNTTRSRLEEANINSLMPARVYYFRVVAYNSLGSGPTSDSLKVITQPEEHVPSAPLNVQVHATSHTTAHVQWDEPEITNGLIQVYKIFYMESESSIEHNIETPNHEADLLGLSVFTEYSIWVVAINQNGAGASSTEVVVRTFSSAPSEAPYNVTVEPASSTSIVIRWEPPPLEGQNGVVTGYKIRYRKQGRKGDTITTPGNSRMHTLINLERSSLYQIRLCAINVNGSGPPTDWLTVETFENDLDEDRVPQDPSTLKVKPSANSITLFWNPPQNQNIKVRKYIVGWGKGVPDITTKELDERQRSFVIDNLEPNSEYVITLRASNNVGPGPAKYANVRTRDEAPPDPVAPLLPPVGLKAHVIKSNAVVLYWTDATLSKSQFVPDTRYYVVRYTSVNNSKFRYYNSTELNCMIVDLKPNTLYEFTVKVVRGRRESPWSMVVQNTTMISAPSSAPRDLTVSSPKDNSQIVTLTWQPPKLTNGAITGYILLYTTDNLKGDRDWLVDGIVGDKHITQLHNLQSTTTYFFKIQARNNKGYGPFSPTVTFRTGEMTGSATDSKSVIKDGKNGFFSNAITLYLIIGGTIIVVTIIAVIIIVLCCRRRDPNISPDRTKKGYQMGTMNINPPDLWIHHDQMELKALEKGHSNNDGSSSCGTVTLHRLDYDAHDNPPSNSLDKRNYVPSYMGTSTDEKIRKPIKPKSITLPVDAKPPKEPVATATAINPSPATQSTGSTDLPAGISTRPPYPRTQYTISRAHVTIDQNALAGAQAPPVESPYATQSAYDSVQSAQPPPTAAYAPGMNVLADAQGGKRLQGHPLRSFSVPAPPPTSAPGTPQAKHVVTVRPNSSPYKKAPSTSSGIQGTPTSRINASNPPPHTAEEVQRLASSYSTEELNQEMANLEGLMKDLNAITASEFELG